jgi:hypothetical protein
MQPIPGEAGKPDAIVCGTQSRQRFRALCRVPQLDRHIEGPDIGLLKCNWLEPSPKPFIIGKLVSICRSFTVQGTVNEPDPIG